MKLVIAEKKSVATAIAQALCAAPVQRDGCYECGQLLVTWAQGHLIDLAMPEDYKDRDWRKWSLDTLPVDPSGHWRWKISEERGAGSRYRQIVRLIRRTDVDCLVNACDPDREGEAIFRRIADMEGSHKPELRLWVASLEAEAIQAYLDQGGDLIVLTDPAQEGQERPNLEALLADYGMAANDGIVLEGDSGHYALGAPFYLLPDLDSHAITEPLIDGGYYILLSLAQGITVTDSPREGLTVESLLTTSDQAYSKLAGYSMETYSKEEGDLAGPFSLAALATEKQEDGTESHVLWIGSTSLVDDQYNQQVSGANEDFFLNCVGWTCQGEEGVSIHAKEITTQYLTVPASTASLLILLVVAVVPAGYLFFGLRIWIRRKRQ